MIPNLFLLSDLLKHDKLLSNKAIPAHLRDIPEYIIDPKTKEANNVVKLTRAAMGLNKPQRRKRQDLREVPEKVEIPLRLSLLRYVYPFNELGT
jgi:ATP-dependent RNA helicase DDX56/DBP9